MQTSSQTVQVLPNSYAVGMAMAQFVADLKTALKGGNAFEVALAIASASLKDIAPNIGLISQVGPEAQADPVDESTTAFLVGQAVYKAIVA